MLRATATIQSPCKLVCELDLSSAHCKGCGRSREEIALWTRYTDQERVDIMAGLDARMKQLGL